jgi:hypothetical protein
MVSHRLVCFTGLSPMHSMKFKGEPSFLRACALPKKDDFVPGCASDACSVPTSNRDSGYTGPTTFWWRNGEYERKKTMQTTELIRVAWAGAYRKRNGQLTRG